MPTINLGSLLIGSSNVEAMKAWYRQAFSVTENEMGAFPLGNTAIFIEEHSQVSGPTKEPARVVINLDVTGCRELETHLKGMGVSWEREVEQMPFGLIGTAIDPDGNFVQIIEWGAQPESHKD